MWSIALTLGSLLVIAMGLTLIGLTIRLARWAACGRLRRTKIYDVISVDGGIEGGSRWTMVVLVVHCGADDEWVRSKLTPLLRLSSSSMTGGDRLSMKTIEADRRQTDSRQFMENLKRSLAECHLAVVVVSSNLVNEISRHGDAISGFLRDSANRCVYVSADGDVGDAGRQTVRRVFGRGVWFLTSDDDVVERLCAEMTSTTIQHHHPLQPLHISRDHEDVNQQQIIDEKY